MASWDVAGPSSIALQARDLPRAAASYGEQLGLQRTPASPPGAVVFATAPVAFAVREAAPGVDLSGGSPHEGYVIEIHDAR